MELYLLKSVACLAILFVFYKAFLEKENMHTFKRFYLLGSLLVSFTIPLITFTTYVIASEKIAPVVFIEGFASEVEIAPNYVPIVLWLIYGLGVLFFSFLFGKNIRALFFRIKKNKKVKSKNIIHVLLNTLRLLTLFSVMFF